MRTKYVFPFHIFLRAIFRENQKSQGTRKKIEFFFFWQQNIPFSDLI